MGQVVFEEFMVNLAAAIREIRKEKGITQSSVAKKINKPQSTVARFESSGVNDSHISLVFQLCEAIEEDLPSVLSKAISMSGANKKMKSSDLDGRWDVLKDKVALMQVGERKELLSILEGIFRLLPSK